MHQVLQHARLIFKDISLCSTASFNILENCFLPLWSVRWVRSYSTAWLCLKIGRKKTPTSTSTVHKHVISHWECKWNFCRQQSGLYLQKIMNQKTNKERFISYSGTIGVCVMTDNNKRSNVVVMGWLSRPILIAVAWHLWGKCGGHSVFLPAISANAIMNSDLWAIFSFFSTW